MGSSTEVVCAGFGYETEYKSGYGRLPVEHFPRKCTQCKKIVTVSLPRTHEPSPEIIAARKAIADCKFEGFSYDPKDPEYAEKWKQFRDNEKKQHDTLNLELRNIEAKEAANRVAEIERCGCPGCKQSTLVKIDDACPVCSEKLKVVGGALCD